MSEKSFLDNFTPKQSFVMGIVLTILILGTFGFIYTLKGGSLSLDSGGSAPQNAAPSFAAPTPGGRREAATPNAREITKKDHIRGNAKAKISVIEYSDTECPFCKRFHPTMNQLIANNDDVRWIYRHFPLDAIHSKARKEAEATECAAEQGKFWEMLDGIFEVTPSNDRLDLATLPDIAQRAGVKNIGKFQECLDSGKYASKVAADLADGQAAGGTGTPYSVVVDADGNQIPVSGAVPLAQLQSVIDSLR